MVERDGPATVVALHHNALLEIEHAADRRSEEFTGVFTRATVERVLPESVRALSPSNVEICRPLLAERFTRERPHALMHVGRHPEDTMPSVRSPCTHHAGRSQMPAGWLREPAGGRVQVDSGGSDPAGEVGSVTVEAMAGAGVDTADTADEFPKPRTDEVIRNVDVVVTMRSGETRPVFPGVRDIDWVLRGPAGQEPDAVRAIHDDIEPRARGLLAGPGVPAA